MTLYFLKYLSIILFLDTYLWFDFASNLTTSPPTRYCNINYSNK